MDHNFIAFLLQAIVLLAVIGSSIVNLALHNQPEQVWLCLLSTSLGILLPTPLGTWLPKNG